MVATLLNRLPSPSTSLASSSIEKLWKAIRGVVHPVQDQPWSLLKSLAAVSESRGAYGMDQVAKNYPGGKIQKAALSESSGIAGGYLVPPDYSDILFETMAENSFIRPRARIIPMASKTIDLPHPEFEKSTGVVGVTPFFGTISLTWGEGGGTGGQISETEPRFRANTLVASSMVAQMVISNQLFDDMTPEGEVALFRLFGEASAWYEEYAFLNGLGADSYQPVGMLNAPCAIQVNRQSPNQVNSIDVTNMCGKMFPLGWTDAIWACSPTVVPQLFGMTGYIPNANPIGADHSGFAGYLMSRPLFVTEKLPALGAATSPSGGDLIFFAPRWYLVGDRQPVVIDVSRNGPTFRNNQTVLRLWKRSTGMPLLGGPVTLQDTTTQVSTIVVLK